MCTSRIALKSMPGMSTPFSAAAASEIASACQVTLSWTRSGRRLRTTPWAAAARMQIRSQLVPRTRKFRRRTSTSRKSIGCVMSSPEEEDHAEGGQQRGRDQHLGDLDEAQAAEHRLDDADDDRE